LDIGADAAGNLFVAAGPNVWMLAPDGGRTVMAGHGSYGVPSRDGPLATQTQLNGPDCNDAECRGRQLHTREGSSVSWHRLKVVAARVPGGAEGESGITRPEELQALTIRSSVLFGISAADPTTYAVVAGGLGRRRRWRATCPRGGRRRSIRRRHCGRSNALTDPEALQRSPKGQGITGIRAESDTMPRIPFLGSPNDHRPLPNHR
jgi:hypothetical protein